MFVFNFKLNKSTIAKILLVILAIICVIIAFIGLSKMLKKITKETTIIDSDCLPSNEVAELTEENYTDVLKMVHDDLNTYIGQQISFTGYVYRVADIQENEFILARDMYIDSNHLQSVVVGFLCSCENAKDFNNGDWVKITGTVEKGYYFGDIPILNISSIEKTSEPENKFVEQPDDAYVPTAVIY
jgi:uncharacterized membrane protein YcgQ (UPF0703/DUF1980 family)